MQLTLELSESPAPPGVMWESLAPAERLAVVAALARLMARSIDDKEEESMSEARSRRKQPPLSPPAKASPKEPSPMAAHLDVEPTLRDAFRGGPQSGSPEPAPVGFICPPCGRFIRTDLDGVVWRARTGSPPRFCSPGCRQAAYRRRRAGVAEGVGLQHGGGRNRSLEQRRGGVGDD